MVKANKNESICTGVVTLLLIIALLTSAQGAENRTEQVNKNVMTEDDVPDGSGFASTATVPAPEMVNIQLLSKPPILTPEKQKQREEYLDKIHLPGPSVKEDKEPAGPSGEPSNAVSLTNSPGTFTIFKNSPLGAGAPSLEKSVVNEPSVGTNGNYIFYTGNWYASRSTDGGATFSYIDPYADMPEFCCDQEVIYDPSRDIFIWYRQGIDDAYGVNRIRLGISNHNASNWFFYDVYPTSVNSGWTNQWWDYPHLALNDNYLYIASNMFNQYDFFTRTVLLRISLDELKAHGALTLNYVDDSTHGTFTPVQGATTTMYWGTHNSVSSLRIYEWGETSSYTWYDRAIPAWTSTSRGTAHCAGPDGFNWCARTDSRLTGGWLANGIIGFFWNVKEGAGFTYPFINAATFAQSDKSYIGRPNIWSSSYAFQYGFVSPDRRGNLGMAAYYGGGSLYPSSLVGISDDYSAEWEFVSTGIGTNGPSTAKWGDYIRVRPVLPSGKIWAATGYTLQGGSGNSNADPRYIEFGRERDALIPLEEAVDNTALLWTTGGNAYWYGQTATSFYGGDAAQSDIISHGQETWVQTSVTGPGTLNFTWNVSSEFNNDFLRFYIDGIEQAAISGETGWLLQSYSIGSGIHTLKWNYTKDISINSGSDAGWLDKVEFSPQLNVTVSESPDPVNSGGTSLVTIYVTTTGGTPVSGASVSLSSTGGTLDPISGTTDVTGGLTSTYTAPVVGSTTTYTISGTASKAGYTGGSGSDPIIVNPTGSVDNIVSIEDVSAVQTSEIRVPIRIINSTGVASVSVRLNYNQGVVLAYSDPILDKGDFTDFYAADNSQNTSGSILINTMKFAPGSTEQTPIPLGLTGNPVVGYVRLRAVGNAGDTSGLNFSDIVLTNDVGNDVAYALRNGTFTIIVDGIKPTVTNPAVNQSDIPDDTDNIPLWGETARLNVTVTDASGIASVTVNLSEIGGPAAKPMINIGGDVYSTTTNASAGALPKVYNFTVNATDTFGNSNTSVKIELRVRKNGDTNGNNVANIGDALRLANNVSYPGNPAYLLSSIYVADVSGNGVINIGDALRLANNVSYPGNPAYVLK